MYSSKILKSRYISVSEPVPINTIISEDIYDYREEDEAEGNENEVREADPEVKVKEIIANAQKEAEAILEKGRLEAENLLQMKKEEADRYRSEVVEGAYEEGYSKGYEEGSAAFDTALEDIKKESLELKESYRKLIEGAEPQIINLVLEIAQKVINEDVKLNKENMVMMIRKALEMCYEKQSAVIKLSQKDFEYLNQNVPDLMSQINSYENISLKQDANLKDGDCIVDTSFGTVDMGMEKCLDKIKDTFIKEVS